MRRLFSFMMLAAFSFSAMGQNEIKAGVYDLSGNAVLLDAEPCVISVELRYVVRQFVPGEYARYAQKYLGDRASLAERKSAELLSGSIKLGKGEEPQPQYKSVESATTLPSNRFSREALTTEERAKETADLIFSLRKHRLDLITGEAGENVFGAGLKAALDEIARLESEYLAMFYGESVCDEICKVVNVEVDNKQSDYVVCRFSDTDGVVAADNLAGKVVLLHLQAPKNVRHPAIKPIAVKSKIRPVEYTIIPDVKCTLLLDATPLDESDFALYPFAQRAVSAPIK